MWQKRLSYYILLLMFNKAVCTLSHDKTRPISVSTRSQYIVRSRGLRKSAEDEVKVLMRELAQNELWWHGPPWLKLTPDHWPNRHRDILDSELCSEELEHRSNVHVAVTQQREALVDINRFSSLKKLLKTTAWVFRFVNNARNIYKSMDFYITADEIQNAEYFWLKCVQSEFYSAEILALKQNEPLRSSSEIKSLVPYLDENNLLRLTGRLLEADLCFGESILLFFLDAVNLQNYFVIREHERIGHCGVSATLTQLRKKYWIPKGRQLVKPMIRICLVCKNTVPNQLTS
ncbi:integrase catalytic domain-containing protein [Trichonephila clavipes]|nr:integrase catalytic domain-containing protein [Trichonephila clavipes]